MKSYEQKFLDNIRAKSDRKAEIFSDKKSKFMGELKKEYSDVDWDDVERMADDVRKSFMSLHDTIPNGTMLTINANGDTAYLVKKGRDSYSYYDYHPYDASKRPVWERGKPKAHQQNPQDIARLFASEEWDIDDITYQKIMRVPPKNVREI